MSLVQFLEVKKNFDNILCKFYVEITAEIFILIKLLMRRTAVILLALIALSCSQIIPNTTPDPSNYTFTEQNLNLTDLSGNTQT